MFPLSLFPLPGELVPLHIFEPRYKQLLSDAEMKDVSFGILFNHVMNEKKIGSLVKLESVIKRFSNGETDIIVKCSDLFHLNKLYRTFRDKLYPGGDVTCWKVETTSPVSKPLQQLFKHYLQHFQIHSTNPVHSFFSIANELNLDFEERLRFVCLDDAQKEHFLFSHLNYQTRLLQEAEKSRNIFHLN